MSDLREKVTDHEYWGNVCSGFGGRLECEVLNFETRERCGRSPYDHDYRPGRHMRPMVTKDLSRTPQEYIGRHIQKETE